MGARQFPEAAFRRTGFATASAPGQLPEQKTGRSGRRLLDFASPISRCASPRRSALRRSVRAWPSVRDLRRAPARWDIGAADLSQDTSNRWWQGRGLSLDSTNAAAAVRYPATAGLFRTLFRQKKEDAQ